MNLVCKITLIVAVGVSSVSFGLSDRKTPAIDVSTPDRVLNVRAENACRIDFRNGRVFGENADFTAHLKNGKYERKGVNLGYELVSLEKTFCFVPDSERESHYAVIVTNWLDCGGSCSSTGVVQLVAIRDGRPTITQQFVFDSHAVGTGVTFDKASLTLAITGRSDDGSPNCCAANFDVVSYHWQRDKFVEAAYRRVPAPTAQHLGDEKPDSVR